MCRGLQAGKWERSAGGAAGGGGRVVVCYLLGLHRRGTAVPTIVVAEGSVVDGITVIVSHEGLQGRREAEGKWPVSILD